MKHFCLLGKALCNCFACELNGTLSHETPLTWKNHQQKTTVIRTRVCGRRRLESAWSLAVRGKQLVIVATYKIQAFKQNAKTYLSPKASKFLRDLKTFPMRSLGITTNAIFWYCVRKYVTVRETCKTQLTIYEIHSQCEGGQCTPWHGAHTRHWHGFRLHTGLTSGKCHLASLGVVSKNNAHDDLEKLFEILTPFPNTCLC